MDCYERFCKSKEYRIYRTNSGRVDINDPNISKYNIACPNDRPINVSSIMVRYRVTREYEEEINICLKNMKIYNINRDSGIVDNKKYILYCENNIILRGILKTLNLIIKCCIFKFFY